MCQVLEKIEEQSQAIGRLTLENRTTREWFKSRLELLCESASKRDEVVGAAMKSILEQLEETSRHVGLRVIGEKMEALLNKAPVVNMLIPNQLPKATPATLPDIIPEETLPNFPDEEPSNKRPAEGPLGENSKRRKVGDP